MASIKEENDGYLEKISGVRRNVNGCGFVLARCLSNNVSN
jgi:hypothetical protein